MTKNEQQLQEIKTREILMEIDTMTLAVSLSFLGLDAEVRLPEKSNSTLFIPPVCTWSERIH